MDSLCHYTTFEALDGILSSKTIWLSNLRYVNDRKEMWHFYECLKKCIKKEMPDMEVEVENLFRQQWARFENETAYAFSLSKAEDDASQWDRYANGGKGVCIKFNPQKLSRCTAGYSFTQPVFYEADVSNHQLKGVIEAYLCGGKLPKDYSDIDGVFFYVWISSGAFKHPSFKAEQEVRIYAHPFEGSRWETLKYITSKDGLREFLPIRLCEENESDYGGAIEGIIIGPNAGIDCELMRRYLKDRNVDCSNIEINISTCPLTH